MISSARRCPPHRVAAAPPLPLSLLPFSLLVRMGFRVGVVRISSCDLQGCSVEVARFLNFKGYYIICVCCLGLSRCEEAEVKIIMECNKEEALRAKGIAENRMQGKDFGGARKIALKAQQLFPDLENISQMLAVCEVHCSADIKVNGEIDWYAIRQVGAAADDIAIKKQYRKLALLLHPDKNQFAGAEAAFKLVGEVQNGDGIKFETVKLPKDNKRKPAKPSGESSGQKRRRIYGVLSLL